MSDLNQGASEAEILPCPFCNGQASAQRYGNRDGGAAHAVWCDSCHISTAWMHGDANASRAIAAWNRRTPAATTGDGELPPLPEDGPCSDCQHGMLYTGRNMQNYARAAIEADRAQRQAAQVDCLKCEGRGTHAAWSHSANGTISVQCGQCGGSGKAVIAPASAQPADRCPSCNGIGWPDGVGGLMQCPTCDRVPSAQPDQRESAAVGEVIEDVIPGTCITARGFKFYDSRARPGDKLYLAGPPAAQPVAKDEQIEPSPMYFDAVKIVKEAQRASVSLVQRRLRISWDAARDMIELMLSRRDVPIEWAPPIYQLNVRQGQDSANNGAEN